MSGLAKHTPPFGRPRYVEAACDREGNALIGSLRAAWRDDFNGAALDPNTWTVVSQGAGQTISLAGGELTIGAGTGAGEETIIRTVGTVTIPFRVWWIARLSQRIANQEVYFEAVNAAGDMAARWKLDATSATQAKYQATNGGNGALSGANTIVTTAADGIFEIELFPDEAWYASRAVDNAGAKSQSYCLTRNVPDPQQDYYLQIRVVNLATPASNTNVIVGALAAQDINELTAEITGGRGDNQGAKQLAVSVPPGVQLSPLTSVGYSNHHHLVSAAGTNATSVTSSAGNIGAIIVANTSVMWRYLKLYAKSIAPVVGTDTPVLTIPLPPNSLQAIHPAAGIRLLSGIAYAITANAADNDATAIGAGEVIVNISRA